MKIVPKFISHLFEGGNVSVVKDGKVLAQAQKIDLKVFDRAQVAEKIKELLVKVNDLYRSEYKTPLWSSLKAVQRGDVFAGSAKFFMDKSLSDEEFVSKKSKIGDIDVRIDKKHLENIKELFHPNKSRDLVGFTYHGRAVGIPKKLQVNTLFSFDLADGKVWIQLDFESAEVGPDGMPDEFSDFGHSATWEDISAGVKGVFHKYLLMCLSDYHPDDIVILTKKQKKVRDNTKLNLSKYAFSIDKGVRNRYRPAEEDGKFHEIESKEADYIRDLKEIFKLYFGKAPDDSEMKKFWSFVGLVELIDANVKSEERIVKIFDLFVKRCWDEHAQQMERDSPDLDRQSKETAIKYLMKKFPFLESKQKEIDEMMKEFYANYRTGARIPDKSTINKDK